MTFSNRRAISTSSLGLHATHTLDRKIRAAAQHGFTGIEIVYADLEAYSKIQKLDLTAAACQIYQLCSHAGLQILSLCPFENYEGHNSPLQERLAKASSWMDIARVLGAAYLQVPAQFGLNATGDEAVVVSELQELADLGTAAEPAVYIAYEPMSWSTYYSTWQSTVRLTELVNRKNFKICLDTFHIATKLWASPYEPSGRYPDAERLLAEDLRAFLREFPIEKLAYIQLSDAERFDQPFSKAHPWFTEGEAAEFTWSKHARPFPLETQHGGYLPVADMVRAWVIEKRFDGWVSMETFDRRTRDEKVTPEQCADNAERSWNKLEKALGRPKSVL